MRNDELKRFQNERISKGYLLTVRDSVENIRDEFFKGEPHFKNL